MSYSLLKYDSDCLSLVLSLVAFFRGYEQSQTMWNFVNLPVSAGNYQDLLGQRTPTVIQSTVGSLACELYSRPIYWVPNMVHNANRAWILAQQTTSTTSNHISLIRSILLYYYDDPFQKFPCKAMVSNQQGMGCSTYRSAHESRTILV